LLIEENTAKDIITLQGGKTNEKCFDMLDMIE
jgi:hypothetical protein